MAFGELRRSQATAARLHTVIRGLIDGMNNFQTSDSLGRPLNTGPSEQLR
jgi:hypothetical protein